MDTSWQSQFFRMPLVIERRYIWTSFYNVEKYNIIIFIKGNYFKLFTFDYIILCTPWNTVHNGKHWTWYGILLLVYYWSIIKLFIIRATSVNKQANLQKKIEKSSDVCFHSLRLTTVFSLIRRAIIFCSGRTIFMLKSLSGMPSRCR